MAKRAGLYLSPLAILAFFVLHPALSQNLAEPTEAPLERASQSLSQDDPHFVRQWTHSVVKSEEAWMFSHPQDEVIVAVIDGGIDIHHPDLKENIWRNPREIVNGVNDDFTRNRFRDDIQGWDFAENDNDPTAESPTDNHGTHVAGLIGATIGNKVGVAGHANNVKIMPLRYLKNGIGYTRNSLKAIRYAVANGARVINLSSGDFKPKASTLKALKEAEEAGVLIVAAAGNYATNVDEKPYYPASYTLSNIISVGATDSHDKLWQDSNFGVKNVHIAAPGVAIYSTVNQGYELKGGKKVDYLSKWGTSMAAPLVSAVAAMIFGARPELTPAEVRDIILNSADQIKDLEGVVAGGRRLNAAKALALAVGGAEGQKLRLTQQ